MTVDSGPVSAPPAAAPTEPGKARPHEGGYRDTVESILIAFILAFVFRAFVVEAFVIPTGSMAPTLLGAHARFTCDECGYKFEANFSSGGGDGAIEAEVQHERFPTPPRGGMRSSQKLHCPNCDNTIHDPTERRRDMVPIHYGDRILVLKYVYLNLISAPQRWDVVVFKSPDDPDSEDDDHDAGHPNAPNKSWYTTNFIKRLVGRPGETLMILDGDVYVSAAGGAAPGNFKLQNKPRHVQEALWRIVCDNDFLPRRNSRPWSPWRSETGSGWDLGTPDQPRRVFSFDASEAAGTIRFDNAFNGGRIADFLAYAQAESGRNSVSDVKLSALYERKSGDGPLHLALTKHGDTFTAELSRGSAKLFRKRGQPSGPDDVGDEIASAPQASALGTNPIQVEFQNVDHVLTLRIGDQDVLQTSYDPDIAALKAEHAAGRDLPKPEVRITAMRQACSLSHVSLWRDVYYTNEAGKDSRFWGRPTQPVVLGDDEFFVLGDNTVISKDARYWVDPVDLDAEDLHVQAGRVPGRFLLGKAFFVYWPAGYRPFGSNSLPGLIPNFGQMRFIH